MALLTPADLDVVRRINVFRGLKPLMVERLVGPATRVAYDIGDIVFRQGDPATAFFIVLDGWVKLYRSTISGQEAVIHVFTKGESFAEAVAFTGHPYPAAASAVTPARVARIPAEHVIRCIRDNPEIALAMIASTSQHLHHLVVQLEQLKAQTGVQRVAEFLLSLCSAEHGGCAIVLPYDKTLIAGRLGLKPESLSRAFAKLRTVGVDVQAAQVVVRDVEQLRRIAEADRGETAASFRGQR